MKRHYASTSSLFLIELILSIFFFILASAVVLQLFVKSHFVSERTISINNALLYTQNIAEVFLANNGDFESVRSLYAKELTEIPDLADHTILLLFDKEWSHTKDIDNARYSILADYEYDTNFAFINIYINEFTPDIKESILSDDYKSVLLDTGYIYHQDIKRYVTIHPAAFNYDH